MNRDFDSFSEELEDFWHRKTTRQIFERRFVVNGCRVCLSSNDEIALQAADHVLSQYSRADIIHPEKELLIQLIFDPTRIQSEPLPSGLLRQASYQAIGDRFHIDFGAWGHCAADLRIGEATAVFPGAMADRPEEIARILLNTLLTNYFFRNGFAMLHATGLVQSRRALMMMAPHNTGKSTTALRLALSGDFRLLTDSMVLVTDTSEGIQLTGFPVGRGKLRRDMLPAFPALAGWLTPEQVRNETKFILDLREVNPALVWDEAFIPDEVVLCLLARSGTAKTHVETLSQNEAWAAILRNSFHFDEQDVWGANLNKLAKLLQIARCYRLVVGTDPAGIRVAAGRLMEPDP